MKTMTYLTNLLTISVVLLACDENDIMPAYEKKGTATSTVATITVSNTTPAPGEAINVTIEFVNPASDPITTVTLRARAGSGTFTDIQSFDEQSAATDTEISHVVNYVAPAAPVTVTFEMVISSQKEYPQVRRTAVTVN